MNRRAFILALVCLFVLAAACGPRTSLTPAATGTPSPEPVLETVEPCETHKAELELSLSSVEVAVGDTVTVTVVLHNTGCLALGLPQFRLIGGESAAALLELPEPAVHNLGVPPGGTDMETFVLEVVGPGVVELGASASFEVHVGYPGPAYWGSASTGEPLRLVVLP